MRSLNSMVLVLESPCFQRFPWLAGRIPLISFVMQGLKFEILFALFPCRRFPPYFRYRPLEVIDVTAQTLKAGKLTVLPHGVDMYGHILSILGGGLSVEGGCCVEFLGDLVNCGLQFEVTPVRVYIELVVATLDVMCCLFTYTTCFVCYCWCVCWIACARTSPTIHDPMVAMDRPSAFGVSAAAACSEFLKSSCDVDTFRCATSFVTLTVLT